MVSREILKIGRIVKAVHSFEIMDWMLLSTVVEKLE